MDNESITEFKISSNKNKNKNNKTSKQFQKIKNEQNPNKNNILRVSKIIEANKYHEKLNEIHKCKFVRMINLKKVDAQII